VSGYRNEGNSTLTQATDLQHPAPDFGDPKQPLLAVRALTKHFALNSGLLGRSAGVVQAVDEVSFDIAEGETLGLVGESGCGKSTTSRLIMALLAPTKGEIVFDGQRVGQGGLPLREYRRQVQMVFQDSYSSLNPRLTVRDSVAFAPQVHGSGRHQSLASADELLLAVGLDPAQFGRRYPHELSGGQRQRINIARALALKPAFLALDEPVSALDVSVGAQVINLLRDLQRAHNLTYLFISHSMPLVRYLSDRVAVMQRGRLVELGTVNDICERPADPYTQTLIAATPELPTP
jgi:peptide/nickel transport system ATP-binding protein